MGVLVEHIGIIVCGGIFTLINLGILALNLKIYTELMKNSAMQRRHEEKK